jgi:hypothetical protein
MRRCAPMLVALAVLGAILLLAVAGPVAVP